MVMKEERIKSEEKEMDDKERDGKCALDTPCRAASDCVWCDFVCFVFEYCKAVCLKFSYIIIYRDVYGYFTVRSANGRDVASLALFC